MNQTEKNMTDEATFDVWKMNDPIKNRCDVMVQNNIIAGLLADAVVERVVEASNGDTIKCGEVKLDPVMNLDDLMRKFYEIDVDTAVSLIVEYDTVGDDMIDISFSKHSSYIITKDSLRFTVENIQRTNDNFKKAIRLDDSGRAILAIGRFSTHDLKNITKRAKKIVEKRLNKNEISFYSIDIHFVSETNLILDKDHAIVGSETCNAFEGYVNIWSI